MQTLQRWAAPRDAAPLQQSNFLLAQLEGTGVSLANATAPFLPVFLARLGASNLEVGLLSSMLAFTGLVLAIAIARVLQGQRKIVPWYAWARHAREQFDNVTFDGRFVVLMGE